MIRRAETDPLSTSPDTVDPSKADLDIDADPHSGPGLAGETSQVPSRSISITPDALVTEPAATSDLDDELGEAIETYLGLVESGQPPEPEVFAAGYPAIQGDLLAALEGLALVRGLVGESEGSGSRLETGRRIAGYRIVRELGRGGMGIVYEAVHVGLDRPVALKVLGTHAAPDSNGRRRFLNEARTAAGLHHTHIVPVFDVGQLGGLCYYAMQRIQGSGLDRVVRHLRRDRSTASGGSTSANPSSFRARLKLASRFAFTPLAKPLRKPRQPVDPALTLADGSLFGLGNSGSRLSAIGSESATGSWHGRTGSLLSLHPTELARSEPNVSGSALPGGSRSDRVDEGPPFTPPRGSSYYRWVAEIGREAAQALGHAHERGVIHRDIKPSNLLIDDLGKVWVADFGLARRMADPGLTQHDSLLGTPRYMSPEQGRPGPIDGRSDLYSLGATLYELLTLRPPFDGRSAAELLDQIAKQEPASLRSIDSRIPRDLETIVLKLLSKRPQDRYANASEVADDLLRFLNMEPVRARRITPIGRAWRFARRHPGITSVSTVATATVMAVSIIAYVRILNERDLVIKAMRTQLWREASVVRLSNMPNRRATGLNLIRESATLKPEADLQTKLRNEALEFLVARDVEARPDIDTGRTRAITFGQDGSRIAALSQTDDGETLALWDFANREKIHEVKLRSDGDNPFGRGAGPGPGFAATPFIGVGAAVAPPNGPGGGGGRGSRGPDGNGGGGGGGGGPFGRRNNGRWAPSGSIATVGPCTAVVGSDRQSIRLFDTETGNLVNQLRFPGRRILSLLATSDGRRLVTSDLLSRPQGESSDEVSERPGRASERGGNGQGANIERVEVNLWDVERMAKPLATAVGWDVDFSVPGSFQELPMVAVSPDGQTFAVARSRRMTVSLWSTEGGEPLGEPIDTQTELSALALGADNLLATAGSGEVRLWDIVSRTTMPALTPNQSFVKFMRFSPRGSLLAVVGWFGRDVELWDTAAHALVAVLPTADLVDDVAFSGDGRSLIASGQASTSSVWTVVEPDVRARLTGFDALSKGSIAFRPDGLLALGSWKGTIRFLDDGRRVLASQPKPAAETPHGTTNGSGSTARDDGSTVATASTVNRDRPVWLAFDHKGRLITLESETIRIYPNPPLCQKYETVDLPTRDRILPTTMVPSSDGRAFLINRPGELLLWQPDTPARFKPIVPPESPRGSNAGGPSGAVNKRNRGGPRPNSMMRNFALAPSASRLYMIDPEFTLQIWEIDDKGQAKVLPNWPNATNNATQLALSADGKFLAIGERSGRAAVYNTADGAVVHRIDLAEGDAEGAIFTLAFGPNGKQLAVGTQAGHVNIWNLAGKAPSFLMRLPGHRGFISALAFDPQGDRLATCSSDKTVDVWDLAKIADDLGKLGLAW